MWLLLPLGLAAAALWRARRRHEDGPPLPALALPAGAPLGAEGALLAAGGNQRRLASGGVRAALAAGKESVRGAGGGAGGGALPAGPVGVGLERDHPQGSAGSAALPAFQPGTGRTGSGARHRAGGGSGRGGGAGNALPVSKQRVVTGGALAAGAE